MRLPRTDELDHVDIGVFGVPLDTATFRGGTRDGPAAIREASRRIPRVNPRSGVSPFDLANVADIGDAPINVLDTDGSLAATREFVSGLCEHSVIPLAVGGDHSACLAVMRGLYD